MIMEDKKGIQEFATCKLQLCVGMFEANKS